MSKFPYSETVLEHFRHPHNVGKMEDPDGESVVGSPACGDMVAVYIKVNAETKVIENAMFESWSSLIAAPFRLMPAKSPRDRE